jgi:quinohemoprotein ethanol dehydrogenase
LRFLPSTIDAGSRTGIFTGVNGVVGATLNLPAGYRLDGEVLLRTPLSQTPVKARQAKVIGRTLTVVFSKADLDNNLPEGDAVPLTLVANFLHNGDQQQLTSTATVRVVK